MEETLKLEIEKTISEIELENEEQLEKINNPYEKVRVLSKIVLNHNKFQKFFNNGRNP